ncbi:L,D-transpeptidase family protein [Streptomyces sp. NPDC002250]|uniref:L,D-transpeptidase family protein n=1 Tax=Streptomyces sp. NPDC002250 TaxID=3364641 RepID=UPI0036762CAF
MGGVRSDRARCTAWAVMAAGTLLAALAACGSSDSGSGAPEPDGRAGRSGADGRDPHRVPGIGPAMLRRIPAGSGQVVAVYGDGRNSADSTVVLYTRHDGAWRHVRDWPAHNGGNGWSRNHRSGDRRSPVGVFTLTDAGGVLGDPGTELPYTQDRSFAAPRWWAKPYWHDFDYVIAIDYNRVRGVPPNDPRRPEGEGKGGSIWLHMDHGSGTSGCVSMSRQAMEFLLRELDPDRRPVVVMGDRADLTGG